MFLIEKINSFIQKNNKKKDRGSTAEDVSKNKFFKDNDK